MKGERQALARQRIEVAGRIAHQGDVFGVATPDSLPEGPASACLALRRGVSQPVSESGEPCQQVVERLAGSIPEKSDAHQARADLRDVALRTVPPLHLHATP